jgi:hypothetical protein
MSCHVCPAVRCLSFQQFSPYIASVMFFLSVPIIMSGPIRTIRDDMSWFESVFSFLFGDDWTIRKGELTWKQQQWTQAAKYTHNAHRNIGLHAEQ